MTNFLVSNYSLLSSPRSAVSKLQQELTIMQKQAATGRLADVGLSLGLRTNQSISLRSESEGVDRQLDTNAILAQRFSVMQNALQSIADTGEAFQKSLIANGTGEAGIAADTQQAMASLQGLMGALNSSSGSRFLFSGAATDQAAISFPTSGGGTADTYFDGSLAEDATATAFAATFGYAQNDAAVSGMTPAELEAFLDGPFDDLFAVGPGGGWTDNWSNADDGTVENRINGSETIKTSYSSNEEAFRNIAKAYVMLSDLGVANMTDETRQLLTSRAVETVSLGLSQLTQMQAEIGGSQNRIKLANESLEARKSVLTISISDLEGVDQYEASTRVTGLETLLETSYALTVRISRLSLLNYL
ncbi:flagellar hook-associated family protein [Aurantimonas sp. 22II-16-19i]|uniref:flagellar hook-associated family protein n=1 Tax=Aurantimonas sp. 22II-16-19i TaxID=1317114 RepID=UPI0009F7F31D|nr:flagellar hook-associated family protein [Aurantimonas sp. 22II-16-19i]ORE97976.1 flagellar hook-associated protein FlgL [Aurantimonas sp. 22II-16-19i]